MAYDNAISQFHIDVFEYAVAAFAPRKPPLAQVLPFVEPAVHVLAVEMKQRISKFENMPHNWDGYGAIPVNPAAIRHAKAAAGLLFRRLPEADIFANPHGTITFEWETPRGAANLEIGDTKFSFFIETDAGIIPRSGSAEDIPGSLSTTIHEKLYADPVPARATANFNFVI